MSVWDDDETSEDSSGLVRNWQGRPYILANPDWSADECKARGFKMREAETRGPSTMYSRVTTYVGCLEDTYSLGEWQERMVVTGMAFDESLVELAQSLDFEGDERELKNALNKIATDAKEAAKWKVKAQKGTAFHRVIEYFDKVGSAPQAANRQTRRLLDAYARETEGWEYLAIEQFMVNDEYKTGGTPDRIRTLRDSDLFNPEQRAWSLDEEEYRTFRPKYRITDLKTGGNDLAYGRQKMAMQLGMYAISAAYDVETGIRTDLDIDLEIAEIVHCPIGTDRAIIYPVDIKRAIEELETARRVRAWRSYDPFGAPYPSMMKVRSERVETPALPRPNAALDATAAAWSAEPPAAI